MKNMLQKIWRAAVWLTIVSSTTLSYGGQYQMEKFVPSRFESPALRSAAILIDQNKQKELKALIDSGLKINQIDPSGISLLLYAAANKNHTQVENLLEWGADPNLGLKDGLTVMELAAGGDDPRLLSLTMANRGNPNLKNAKHQPITFTAASQNRWDNLKTLLDGGADINATDRAGNTLLHYMAEVDNYPLVYNLLQKGADYRKTDSSGWTLAHFINSSRLNVESDEGRAMEKCKQFLVSKGVIFPPTAPSSNVGR